MHGRPPHCFGLKVILSMPPTLGVSPLTVKRTTPCRARICELHCRCSPAKAAKGENSGILRPFASSCELRIGSACHAAAPRPRIDLLPDSYHHPDMKTLTVKLPDGLLAWLESE